MMEAEKYNSKQSNAQKRLSNSGDEAAHFNKIKHPKLENIIENERTCSNLSKAEFESTNNSTTCMKVCKSSLSPKKRLQITVEKPKEKFIYGNYSQYYGYRNKDFQDVRLEVFEKHIELFENKQVLDIGCNNGFITTAVAKRLNVKTIIGLDIDRTLVKQAIKNIVKVKKTLPMDNEARTLKKFPFNVQFIQGNYVLKDDVLLEIERPQFDLILCLSITKWIQLNFGDAGLKQAFRRMFLQLNNGGILILEAQPLKNYRKRKYVSEEARINFKEMNFFPEEFTNYLLSSEIGFKRTELLDVPETCTEGFKRPIQIFYKE